MKKIVTLILALVLTAAFSLTAYATEISNVINVQSELQCHSDFLIVNNGVITIADNAIMTIYENITVTIQQGGTLEIKEGGKLILEQGSKIVVDGGTYINNGTLTNNGGTIVYRSATIDSVTDPNNKTDFSVIGSYTPGQTTSTVYSVDVTWGSMEFKYTDKSDGTWNPKTHDYDDSIAANWSCADGANKITVKNHSNAAVTATPSYTPASGFTAVTGGFNTGAAQLASAVNTAVTAAPSAEWTLSLSGALASSTTTKATLGTVTVTLS